MSRRIITSDVKWKRSIYDIFGSIFSTFLYIWRQIRWELEAMLMLRGTYCIVFTRVVVTPHVFCTEKSCKSTNQDITWRIMDMKIEVNGSLKILEDNTKWIKLISSSKALQDERTDEKGLKSAEFAQEGLPHAPLRTDAIRNSCFLVFQDGSMKKSQFSSLKF